MTREEITFLQGGTPSRSRSVLLRGTEHLMRPIQIATNPQALAVSPSGSSTFAPALRFEAERHSMGKLFCCNCLTRCFDQAANPLIWRWTQNCR